MFHWSQDDYTPQGPRGQGMCGNNGVSKIKDKSINRNVTYTTRQSNEKYRNYFNGILCGVTSTPRQ